ncbi:MAG: thiol-disulfide isomerase/thioredoxin [Gammaproteobacteria bacterium]|jgi:thiol-disulfide isomerase/thioredoxin
MEIRSDLSFFIKTFDGEGDRLVIWLPSERGVSPNSAVVAGDLSFYGVDVWQLDLHDSYMLPRTRESISQIPYQDVSALIDRAISIGYSKVFFISQGRGARLTLEAIHHFSVNNPDSNVIRGSILFHPQLVEVSPNIGETAEYSPIASASHLPVYLVMAEYSTKYLRSMEIGQLLQQGGSSVFVHLLNNVNAGFFSHEPEGVSEADVLAKTELPELLNTAMGLLDGIESAKYSARPVQRDKISDRISAPLQKLGIYSGDLKPVNFKLLDLNGGEVDFADYHGKVTLVNFWATWCTPCVKEIPSLMQLKQLVSSKDFEILTINIGESKEKIERFANENPFNLPVLIDLDGKTIKDWRVYVYPSNYILDKTGRIKYAHRGALDWSDPDIVKIINKLVSQ